MTDDTISRVRGTAVALPQRLHEAGAELVADLVDANRILYRQGIVDAFGHISARHPSRPSHFLLARNVAPALVTAEDIMEFDTESEPVGADAPRPYLERFIHGEIFRKRPEVMAVVHTHSPSVIPFGVVPGATLRPIYHMCGFMGGPVPVFEIREGAGDGTDLLIRSRALGAALAQSLGSHSVVLMRGHGITITAPGLRQAVYRAIYTEANAKLQCQAIVLGAQGSSEPIYLTGAEAMAAADMMDGQLHRPWDLWRSEAWR
jgi:ribulose-5-phosphate 4-epimerase/fuculose-1-phosphate aldolase